MTETPDPRPEEEAPAEPAGTPEETEVEADTPAEEPAEVESPVEPEDAEVAEVAEEPSEETSEEEPDEVTDAPAAPEGPAPPLREILEAVLFTSSLPVGIDRLKEILGVEERGEIRALVEELRIDYEVGKRAFQVEEIAGGFVLLTRPEYAEWVTKLKGRREEVRLSKAALETLAVIAYRQPVLRVDVEKIRGVGCGPVIRSLLEQGLVRVSGRAELPGSPLLYATTPRFLKEFGLASVKDLPRDREL
jgi:segregation and condensation protein B